MKYQVLTGLIASLFVGSAAWAQPPVLAGTPAAAPAAAPSNLWSFICPTPDQKSAFKTCFCNSALGQMVNGAAGPASMMSGGLLGNCCLQNSIANDVKKPADTPDGLAGRVQKDAEDAKARRAAVRLLGTVDCNYWPDAIDVLITCLRFDRSECVRFEAALALQGGCCCNAKVVKALTICVIGGTEDGFPSEHSDRVRAAAADALAHCVVPLPFEPLKEEENKERPRTLAPAPTNPVAFYKAVGQMSRDQVMDNARAALAQMHIDPSKASAHGSPAAAYPIAREQRRGGSVGDILANALGTGSRTTVPPASVASVMAPTNSPANAVGAGVPSGSAPKAADPTNATLVSQSKPTDRPPVTPPVAVSPPMAPAPAVQASAPRRQSLFSILQKGWSRPQETTNAPSVTEPHAFEVEPINAPPTPSRASPSLPPEAPRSTIPVTPPNSLPVP